MPIEFRCPQCMKLLRVGDDAMGKQAKCPACGSLAQVPNSLAEPLPPAPPSFNPPPPPAAGNPFGPAGENPFGGGYAPPLAPPSDNPYAAPLSGGESTPGYARPTKITINGVIEDAWAVFKANFWMLVAVHFVEWIIDQVYSNGGSVVIAGIQGGMRRGGGGDMMILGLLQMAYGLGNIVLSVWLTSGRDLYFISAAKNLSPQFSLLFNGHAILGKRIALVLLWLLAIAVLAAPPAVIGGIVAAASGDEDAGLVVGFSLGAVSLIAFIWLNLVYAQSWLVVLDQPVTVMESLRVSRSITEGNRLVLFALQIIIVLVMMGGVCLCGIGILVSLPLAYMMSIVAYMQMSGQRVVGGPYVTPPRERALPAQPNF